MKRRDIRDRIAEKIERDLSGCWLWIASMGADGYGRINFGDSTLAHRAAYTAHVGPIPDGMVLDHLCRVRRCVNPEHLEVVTQQQNVLRGIGAPSVNAKRMYCPRGHPYDEANTYRNAGRRYCRACGRERRAEK